MVEKNGMPKLGATATMLGIRIGTDIVPDASDAVHRPAFVPGEKNGLSCAATIETLPRFTLPVEWGGLNKRSAVWRIEDADLPAELVAGTIRRWDTIAIYLSGPVRRWIIMTLYVQLKRPRHFGRRSRRIEAIMNLRGEFETAWRAGDDPDSLLALVHRHRQRGLAATEAYGILEQLWLENGFDDCDGSSPLQNNLEYVLEKLWYEQPATK
jgi:hypothetical protein